MEKEQEKCELCEYITAINTEAAEERKYLKEHYGEDRDRHRVGLIEERLKYTVRARSNGRVTFGMAYRDDYDNVRFKFFDCINKYNCYTHTISDYIQYCPYCGRKIKQ